MKEVLHDLIIEKESLAPDIYKFTLESEYVVQNARPGQFVNIRCGDGMDTVLRRPISICSTDRLSKRYDIVFQVKGKGTGLLAEKQTGTRLDVLGPLGNSFDTDIKYRRIAVVGGGIGIFPLLFLLRESRAPVKRAYLGFRSSRFVTLENEFEALANSLEITTDDGTYGSRGFITDLLERDMSVAAPDIIYACGPLPMLKKVALAAAAGSIPCQVSLEQRMGCGFGACLVCACKTGTQEDWKYSHVCKDGPVFWSSEVLFDDQG